MNVQHKSAGGAKMEAAGTVHGYAATFDREPDSYGDVIRAGAFDATVKEWAEKRAQGIYLPLLYGHNTEDPEYNIGRVIDMGQDERGLWGDVEINPKDRSAMDLYERVKRGDVDQCSFGFEIKDEDTDIRADGSMHWTIKDVELYEVSVCTFPAYEATSVSARTAERDAAKARALEAWRARMREKLGRSEE